MAIKAKSFTALVHRWGHSLVSHCVGIRPSLDHYELEIKAMAIFFGFAEVGSMQDLGRDIPNLKCFLVLQSSVTRATASSAAKMTERWKSAEPKKGETHFSRSLLCPKCLSHDLHRKSQRENNCSFVGKKYAVFLLE